MVYTKIFGFNNLYTNEINQSYINKKTAAFVQARLFLEIR